MALIVKYSKHAREQMVERGISVSEVEEGITKGAKHIQPESKIVSEYRYFAVVYKRVNEVYYVITVKPRW